MPFSLKGATLFFLLTAFVACTKVPVSPTQGDPFGRPLPLSGEVSKDSLQKLMNTEYSIVSNEVRSIYSAANKTSRVRFVDGVYQSGDAVLLKPYDSAVILPNFAVQGVLATSSDGRQSIVVPLVAGTAPHSLLEIAILEASGAFLLHRVSYPLGRATLESLRLESGHIHARVRHQLLLDPGIRTTEYVLGKE